MTWDDIFILIFRTLLHLLNCTARTNRAMTLTKECESALQKLQNFEIVETKDVPGKVIE